MFKTQVELVTGFIGSGKTTFIKSLLEETFVDDEKIVVLQLEKGQEELAGEMTKEAHITYLTKETESLTLSYLSYVLLLYEPDRLIIECNGMSVLDELLLLLNDAKVKKRAFITTLFNLIEAPSFKVCWQNLKPLLMPALSMSDMIIVTKSHMASENEKEDLKNLLEEENTHEHILFANDTAHLKRVMNECRLLDSGWFKVIRIKLNRQLKKIESLKGEKG